MHDLSRHNSTPHRRSVRTATLVERITHMSASDSTAQSMAKLQRTVSHAVPARTECRVLAMALRPAAGAAGARGRAADERDRRSWVWPDSVPFAPRKAAPCPRALSRRKEPRPLSLVLMTVNVVAPAWRTARVRSEQTKTRQGPTLATRLTFPPRLPDASYANEYGNRLSIRKRRSRVPGGIRGEPHRSGPTSPPHR